MNNPFMVVAKPVDEQDKKGVKLTIAVNPQEMIQFPPYVAAALLLAAIVGAIPEGMREHLPEILSGVPSLGVASMSAPQPQASAYGAN